MTAKLQELMGTRYMTGDHASKLRKLLDEIATGTSNITEVDLANVKFMPGAVAVLRSFYGKVAFCNSEDAKLDWILKHNGRVPATPPLDASNSIDIPNNLSMEEVFDFFSNIDPSKVYTLKNASHSAIRAIALAILTIMKRPDVVVDLDDKVNRVFKQVRLDWTKVKQPHDSYYATMGVAITKCDRLPDGKFQMPGEAPLPEDVFVRTYTCIPAEFGNVKGLEKTDEFRDVWEVALETLQMTPVAKTLKVYLDPERQ